MLGIDYKCDFHMCVMGLIFVVVVEFCYAIMQDEMVLY